MQFISIARRRTESFTPEAFEPLLEPEAEKVRELYARGVVRAVWSREDVLGAVMLLEASSREALDAELATLPLSAAGMLEITVMPIKAYRGFGPRVVT
jgi:muconolactone delta-isomerase